MPTFTTGHLVIDAQLVCEGKGSWVLLTQFTLHAILHQLEHNFFSDAIPSQTNKRNKYIWFSIAVHLLVSAILFDMHKTQLINIKPTNGSALRNPDNISRFSICKQHITKWASANTHRNSFSSVCRGPGLLECTLTTAGKVHYQAQHFLPWCRTPFNKQYHI
jgi:hypothetical protein